MSIFRVLFLSRFDHILTNFLLHFYFRALIFGFFLFIAKAALLRRA